MLFLCINHYKIYKPLHAKDGVTQSFYTDVAAELCSDSEGLDYSAPDHTTLTAQYHNVPQVVWKTPLEKLPFDQVFGALGRTPATKSRDARDSKQLKATQLAPTRQCQKDWKG